MQDETPIATPVEQTREQSQLKPGESLPSGVDPEAVRSKMTSGLSKAQAIQVLLAQGENDQRIAKEAGNK